MPCGRGGHPDNRLVEHESAGRAVERCRPVREDAPVVPEEPVPGPPRIARHAGERGIEGTGRRTQGSGVTEVEDLGGGLGERRRRSGERHAPGAQDQGTQQSGEPAHRRSVGASDAHALTIGTRRSGLRSGAQCPVVLPSARTAWGRQCSSYSAMTISAPSAHAGHEGSRRTLKERNDWSRAS